MQNKAKQVIFRLGYHQTAKKITIPCLKGNYQLSVCDTLDKHTNIVIFYIYILFLSFISDSGDK